MLLAQPGEIDIGLADAGLVAGDSALVAAGQRHVEQRRLLAQPIQAFALQFKLGAELSDLSRQLLGALRLQLEQPLTLQPAAQAAPRQRFVAGGEAEVQLAGDAGQRALDLATAARQLFVLQFQRTQLARVLRQQVITRRATSWRFVGETCSGIWRRSRRTPTRRR